MALLGLGSEPPSTSGTHPVVPREFLLALLKREKLLGAPAGVHLLDWEVCDVEVHGFEARGSRSYRHAQARFPPRPDWGFTATEYAVGVAGAIGAELIVEGAITETGVVPPERCIPPGRSAPPSPPAGSRRPSPRRNRRSRRPGSGTRPQEE